MFFDLFGKNKDEFITAYAGKLAEAVLEDALDEDVLEELIHTRRRRTSATSSSPVHRRWRVTRFLKSCIRKAI